MDKPDKIWVDSCDDDWDSGTWGQSRENDTDGKYLLATPERELASELVEALREVVAVADAQESGRCYSDSKIGWEMAMYDVAKEARAVLAKLEGKG